MDTTTYTLHLISSDPTASRGNPDDTARELGTYETRDEAHRAGREYLREHPEAWLQVQLSDLSDAGEDVSR